MGVRWGIGSFAVDGSDEHAARGQVALEGHSARQDSEVRARAEERESEPGDFALPSLQALSAGSVSASGTSASGSVPIELSVQTGGALDQVWHLLAQIPDSALCEPQCQIGWVVAEAQELVGILRQHTVRQRIVAAGLPRERMDLLGPLTQALSEAEARWVSALCPLPEQARAFEDGQQLRDEMLSACRWNLRSRGVSSELARITDSTDPAELSLDLRELAELVTEHSVEFAPDRSFRPSEVAAAAQRAARTLSGIGQASRAAWTAAELRRRAFTCLMQSVEEVRSAGRYAFRGTAEARRLFASNLAARRRPAARQSLLRIGEG